MSQHHSPVEGIYAILDAQWLAKSDFFIHNQKHIMDMAVADMKAAAISIVQLRCKQTGKDAYHFIESWISLLRTQCPGMAIIINDRVDLALYFEADGVHMGQDDLPINLCRKLLGPKKLIGLSTHSLEEISHAAETTADYIGFGPIFSTETKADTEKSQGVESLREASQKSALPVVAIGGIGLEELPNIRRAKAASAAMISGLWDKKGGPQFSKAMDCWQRTQ
jgi:thiamine-phosphate pyrophosphorylase